MPTIKLFIVSLFCLSFFFSFTPILADYTEETFNQEISNNTLWDNMSGLVDFAEEKDIQYSIFKSLNFSHSFPYYRTHLFNNLGIIFDYATIVVNLSDFRVTQGAGIILSDNTPLLGDPLLFSNLLFFVWPKPDGSFHLFTNLCPISNIACDINYQIANGVYQFETNIWITIKFQRVDNSYRIYVNDELVFSTIDTGRIINSIGFGSPIYTSNTQVWPTIKVDYLGINTDPITITPFPFLSQLDPAWKDEEYDTATSWVEGEGTSIGDWGCALTSAAMVLKKFEVKSPTDGANTTPSNLNTWLLSEPDGYVRGGLLNWLAVTRYALLANDEGESPTALEYKRKSYDALDVKIDIDSGLYPILTLPGHFIVAYEDQSLDWGVADPLEMSVGTQTKTDEILRSNILKPSSTDLGYFLFVTSVDTNVELRDENGELVPIDESIEWITNGSSGIDGPRYKHIYVAKPTSGTYKLFIDNRSSNEIPIDIYLYTKDGEVREQTFSQQPLTMAGYKIEYSNSEIDENIISELDITPPQYVETTKFKGWYNSSQTAYFYYIDENMSDTFEEPSCVIDTEGRNQSCDISPNVCDIEGNCNTEAQASRKVNIDFTKPEIKIVQAGKEIRGLANDGLSGIDKIEIELSKIGEDSSTHYIARGTRIWQYKFADLDPGNYSVRAIAIDKAGNVSESREDNFRIDEITRPVAIGKYFQNIYNLFTNRFKLIWK